MVITAHIIAYLFAVAVGSCVLVLALWLLSEKDSNPIGDLGTGQCFLRAGGICVVALVLELVLPSGVLFLALRSAVWWGAIMFLFDRTPVQALLLGIANSFLMTVVVALLKWAVDALFWSSLALNALS